MPTRTLSSLVVTKNRPELTSWLFWNLRKQTRQSDELVVVVSGSEDTWRRYDEAISVETPKPSRIIYLPENKVTGEARQAALDAATCDYITFWDDDDWYSPTHTERLMELVEKHSWKIVTEYLMWFYYLPFDVLVETGEWTGYPLPKYTVFERQLAQSRRFPPTRLSEDVVWLRSLVGRRSDMIHVSASVRFPLLNTVHEGNVWNTVFLSQVRWFLEYASEPFNERLLDVSREEQDETRRRYDEMFRLLYPRGWRQVDG